MVGILSSSNNSDLRYMCGFIAIGTLESHPFYPWTVNLQESFLLRQIIYVLVFIVKLIKIK